MKSSAEMAGQWVRDEIRALAAYHVPNPDRLIKLDAMENPYGWPEPMVEQWLEALREVPLNRYPDPGARHLTERLRQAMHIPPDMDVLLGNGSDELIQIIALALSGAGRKVLAPEPSFVMYRMVATFAGMDYLGVPLRADFSLDVEAMLEAIAVHQPALVFLAYPNNPTGNLFAEADVEAVLRAAPGLVVVDEAYHAFAAHSFLGRLGEFPNLVVMRTVSKLGLAGLRLGFLAGPRAWLGEFDKVRLPYNINVLTQVSVDFALAHAQVFATQTALIREERERVAAALGDLAGVTAYPSAANFILFRVAEGQAGRIFDGLKRDGILIKNLAAVGGLLNDCLRVTIGTREENDAFLGAVSRLCA